MIKAVFLDFYGTVVFEDDEPIGTIVEQIYQSGNAENKKEIAKYWWQRFSDLCSTSFGEGFLTQRELELQSLSQTLEKFGVIADAEELSKPQFAYWKQPPIFEDSKIFFEKCPLPVFIVSNIDTIDLNCALNFHKLNPAGVVTSEETRAYKPRHEIFELALQKFGFKADEVVHMGDSISSDVVGAKALGIRSVWINRKGKPTLLEVDMQAINLIEGLEVMEKNAL